MADSQKPQGQAKGRSRYTKTKEPQQGAQAPQGGQPQQGAQAPQGGQPQAGRAQPDAQQRAPARGGRGDRGRGGRSRGGRGDRAEPLSTAQSRGQQTAQEQAPQDTGLRANYRGAQNPGGLQRTLNEPQQAAEALAGLSLGGNGNGNGNGGNGNGGRGTRSNFRGRRDISGQVYKSRPPGQDEKKGLGDQCLVHSNYYEIKKNSQWILKQYDIKILPEEDRTRVKKQLVQLHKNIFKTHYIFDGNSLYTQDCLPNKETIVEGRKEDGEMYKITFTRIKELNPYDIQYIQILNIILRRCQEHLQLTLVGRNYYDQKAAITIKQHNIEIWPGITTSIRHHEDSILLNVDLSHKIIRNETVLQVMRQLQTKRLDTSLLLGSIIMSRYNSRTYKLDQIDESLSPKSTFLCKDKQKSYVDYYKEKYNVCIRDLGQPLLKSIPKERDRRRGDNQDIILIPELCVMTGISEEMKSNFRTMQDIAVHTKPNPNQRVAGLQNFNQRLRRNQNVIEELKSWDLTLSPDLVQFAAHLAREEKILQGPPQLNEQQRSATYDRSKADWTQVTRGKKMNECMRIMKWAVICPIRDQRATGDFIRELQIVGPPLGIMFPEPEKCGLDKDQIAHYVRALHNYADFDLVMVVVANNRADKYGALKKECSHTLGIPSQFLTSRTVNRDKKKSIATKVAIQINCKLGGEPWNVAMPFHAMFVGYDTHHHSRQRGVSFGATVATFNRMGTKYFCSVNAHRNAEELSSSFYQSIKDAVLNYAKQNGGNHPPNIMLYRDGVGDSQIEYVKEVEVKAIKEMLADTYPDVKQRPKLVVTIVSKRINSRIFTRNNNGYQNPLPGTVVDSVITLPERYDFFLVSQAVNQGTVSPTSYNVIHNETSLTPDQMQRMAYKLCHLYYNWQGTVAVPAPCMYAHKLAFMSGTATQERVHPKLVNKLWFL